MRIQKEIDNVERVKEKIATMPLTMEDAIEFHKRVVERVEKERKEINKELGIGDVEKDGFTGRTKNFKTSTPELKKMKLSESLFEPLNEGYRTVDEICRDVQYTLRTNGFENFSPFVNSSGYDWISIDCGSDPSVRPEMFQVLRDEGYDADYDDYDNYIEIYVGDLYESLNEDDSGSIFVQQAEEEDRERKAEEAKKRKKKAEEEKKARLKDKVWAEKDWIAEKAKAEKEGRDLDLSKYSKEEQDIVKQGLEDFANDETAQAQYLRKKEKEMKDAAEKAEKEEKAARKELFGYSGDKEDITKAIGNVGKAIAGIPDKLRTSLSKAGGINI